MVFLKQSVENGMYTYCVTNERGCNDGPQRFRGERKSEEEEVSMSKVRTTDFGFCLLSSFFRRMRSISAQYNTEVSKWRERRGYERAQYN